MSRSSETTSARIEAVTIPHTGVSTAPNSSWGPVVASAGSLATSQKNSAMNTLIAAARTITVRAALLPATLWTRSRSVKVNG